MKAGYTITHQILKRPYIIIVSNYEYSNEVYLWGGLDEPTCKSLTDIGMWKIKYKIK